VTEHASPAIDLSAWLAQLPAGAGSPLLREAVHIGEQRGGVLGAAWHAAQPQLLASLDLLRALGVDEEAQAACIVHVLRSCDPQPDAALLAALPAPVRALVEGQEAAERVWALHAAHGAATGSEGLRRLLLAIIRDLRVVFILLARQLVRMRALADAPEAERVAAARLTADMHAPLANRLGIWQLKWELEDLAFRYLQPDVYRRIAHLLDERRGDREAWIATAKQQLGAALAKAGLRAEIGGRPKHIYSIWRKMQRKGLEFSELYDVRALRLIVDDVAACYAALGVVHSLWPFIPGEFDDYIANPKGNHYQSLHTAVIGPEGRTLEVQIRSHDMHEHAELGVAAHWRYKEGGGGDASFERKIAWMRQLLESREADDDAALLAGFRTEVVEDRVYLLTPKGNVVDLPQGATVLDFAYTIHTDVGHRCRGAKVNGRIVPLGFQPASGDRIEILTGKIAEPRRDWLSPQLGFLRTHRARNKVRAWFNRIDTAQNLAAGRAVLERELKRLALPPDHLERLPEQFRLKTQDELLHALALGDVSPGQLARALHELGAPPAAPTPVPPPAVPASARSADGGGAIVIEGVGNLLSQLARCCQPLPGDAIVGYITRGRGISVHRADCAQVASLRERDADRVVEVTWGKRPATSYEVDVVVRGFDRKWLHKDVSNAIAAANVQVVALNARVDAQRGVAEMNYTLKVADFGQLSGLLAQLMAVPNVTEARRLA